MTEHREPDFAGLSSETRSFLINLRKDDIALLQAAIELVRSTLTVGRFVKWLLISAAGALLGTIMLGEAIVKAAAWLRGVNR